MQEPPGAAASCKKRPVYMAESIKQVFDIRPGKGMSDGQSNEHQRNWTERGWEWATRHGNYDRTRERLNFGIVKGGKVVPVDKSKSIGQRMAESLQSRGIKDPNEGLSEPGFRTVANIIFGGSRERMHQLAFGNQRVNFTHGADNSHICRNKDIERWAQDVYRFACEHWGEDNVVGFYVHLDELNPHVHCSVIPMDPRGRISYNKVFGGNKYDSKQRFYFYHDEFAKVNEKWGMKRGTSIALSGAKHRTTEEYRRALSEECTTLEEQVENNRKLLGGLLADIRFAEKRVKGLGTMTVNLEEKKKQMIAEMEALAEKLKASRGDSEELRKKISKLDLDLQKVLDNLTDKRGKLEEANRQLSELRQIEEETRERAVEYRRDLKAATYDLEHQVRYRLADALLGDILNEFKSLLPALDGEGQNLFDGTLLKDVAERGEDIFKCAIYLFANYVDLATTFAESHGGGGGDNDLPWGRKEDEDDRAWARRCLIQASRMMKPKGGKNVRRK